MDNSYFFLTEDNIRFNICALKKIAVADGSYKDPEAMATAVRAGQEDSSIFNKRCITVVKNRLYDTRNNIYLMFDGKRSRFTQIAKDYQEDYQRSRSTRRL